MSPHAAKNGVIDETTPLFVAPTETYASCSSSDTEDAIDSGAPRSSGSILGILAILLIGVFVSQADTMLVLATYGSIASEFNDLQNASWLLSSYMLAMCVAQPLYGKLSDIFGRKTMLQVSYSMFAGGSALCGICQSMPQLIAARAIQGIGGAGMVCLVSILLTDLVPIREVAAYRSYVNVIQTVGRSSGGAIGGVLAQVFGWRGTLAGQAPLTLLGMALVAWKLKLPKRRDDESQGALKRVTTVSKLKRVDFVGAILMSISILSFLLILDIGGDRVPWTSTLILGLTAICLLSSASFLFAERFWAKEPIFPLHLLTHYDVVTSYVTLAAQNAAQTALMFFIPLYFQIIKNATPGEAGGYMIPSIAGNTVGGLIAGVLVKKYGRTKWILIGSAISAGICFTLLLLFWRGNTPIWQSLFVFPGGFATAVAHSVAFVAVAVRVEDDEMAIAASGLYLAGSVGAVAGLSAASAFFQTCLRSSLKASLSGYPDGAEVARRALQDINYVQGLTGKFRELVVGAYILSFRASFGLCLGLSGICLIVAVISRENRLK